MKGKCDKEGDLNRAHLFPRFQDIREGMTLKSVTLRRCICVTHIDGRKLKVKKLILVRFHVELLWIQSIFINKTNIFKIIIGHFRSKLIIFKYFSNHHCMRQ
jgi:hypothetical protein